MNNFDTIFSVVQTMCTENAVAMGNDVFQHIAAAAGIPIERVLFYLDCMEQTGLLKYSTEKQMIMLTEKGITAEHVFS